MKKILHLLLGLGFTVILVHSGLAAPVETKVSDWPQVELEHLVLAVATVDAPVLEALDQKPAIRLALQMGNYTEASKAFSGIAPTRFARSSISPAYPSRWQSWHYYPNPSFSRYCISPCRRKVDPGRSAGLYKAWPKG